MIIINCKIWFINRLPVLQVSIWKWQKMLGVSKPNVFCSRSSYLSWRCLMSTWKPSQADHISTLPSDASKELNSRDVLNWRQDVKINWTHCGFEPTVDLWEPVDLEIPSDSWSNNANLPPPQEKSGETESAYRSFVIRVQWELWVSQGYFMLLGDMHFHFTGKDGNRDRIKA